MEWTLRIVTEERHFDSAGAVDLRLTGLGLGPAAAEFLGREMKAAVKATLAAVERERATRRVVAIHILRYGSALCGFPGVPRDWPPGHFWVHEGDADANCTACLALKPAPKA